MSTLDHYNRSFRQYFDSNHTLPSARMDIDFFLAHLWEQIGYPLDRPLKLLDAGSGTGRDTLAFLSERFEVEAFDGSPQMAALSSELTGQTTRVMRFEALDLPNHYYDCIWAMASLLHVARHDLPSVVSQLAESLRENGLLFASFKCGDTERTDSDGRVFTDLDMAGAVALEKALPELTIVATMERLPPSTHRNARPWFSVIFRKNALFK